MSNPLVAPVKDSTTSVSGVPLLEDATGLKSAIESKDWAGVAMGAVGTALDALTAVMDPFGAIFAAGVGWLIEHVGPLKEALNALTGDADQIAAQSETWANVAKELESVSAELTDLVKKDLESWKGDAADAYRKKAEDTSALIASAQKGCEGAGSGVKTAGEVVGAVRTLVRDTIAELVGHLISWALQVVFTLGIGMTWVVPQVIAAVAKTASKITQVTTKLVKAIKALVPLLKKAGTLFEDAGKALKNLKGGKVKSADKPKDINVKSDKPKSDPKDNEHTDPSGSFGGPPGKGPDRSGESGGGKDGSDSPDNPFGGPGGRPRKTFQQIKAEKERQRLRERVEQQLRRNQSRRQQDPPAQDHEMSDPPKDHSDTDAPSQDHEMTDAPPKEHDPPKDQDPPAQDHEMSDPPSPEHEKPDSPPPPDGPEQGPHGPPPGWPTDAITSGHFKSREDAEIFMKHEYPDFDKINQQKYDNNVPDHNTNCGNCTSSTADLLLHGKVNPAGPSKPQTLTDVEGRTDFGGKFQPVGDYGKLHQDMLSSPPGTHASIAVKWPGESVGHFFNAHRAPDGTVRYLDGQSGLPADMSRPPSEIWTMKYPLPGAAVP